MVKYDIFCYFDEIEIFKINAGFMIFNQNARPYFRHS